MKDIIIGEMAATFCDSETFALINQHVTNIDNQLVQELVQSNGYHTKKYEELLKERGFTFDEYVSLFHPPTSPLDYHKYPIYQVLRISSNHRRRSYTLRFSNDEQGYMNLLDTIPAIRAMLQKRKLRARIPYKRMWEHVYINGASGSGKSTLMKRLLYTLSERKNGLVLLDPQGKLASQVRSFKHLDKDRLVYFKPTIKQGYSPVLNFLEKDRGEDTNSMALRLARVISIISKGELSNPMVSLLRPCLAVLLENEGYNLSDLKRFLLKEENEDLVQLGLSHPDLEYQSTFKRINTGYYNKTRDAIISKLDVVLQDRYFRNLTTGASTINLKKCVEQGKIIIFDLGGLDTDTIQAFGRLVVALLLHIALERDSTTIKKSKRTFLFIDEMQNFLSPDIIKILDEARQKKLHLVMAHQRIGQLKANIKTNVEENFIDAMMGNTAIKIVGHNDSPETINVLSSKLGMNKEKLIGIPNYEFLLRVRGRTDLHFKSSNAINNKRLYLSKKEVRELDQYMLQKYYTPAGINSGSAQGFKREAFEDKKTSKQKDEIPSMNIALDDDDF